MVSLFEAIMPEATDEEADTYRVLLEAVGPHRLEAVAILSELLNVGRDVSLGMVNSTPCIVAEGLDQDEAQAIYAALDGADIAARVDLVEPMRRVTFGAAFDPDNGDDKKRKMKAIGLIREYFDMGVSEAKALVEALPSATTPLLPRSKATSLLEELSSCGIAGYIVS